MEVDILTHAPMLIHHHITYIILIRIKIFIYHVVLLVNVKVSISILICTSYIIRKFATTYYTQIRNNILYANSQQYIIRKFAIKGAVIHCPLNAGCFISCDGDRACNGAIFEWVDNQPHNVTCGQYVASCNGITINPIDNNQDFTVNCSYNSMCWHSIINCPTNASCTIWCLAQNACGETIINGPINNPLTIICGNDQVSGCQGNRIYAQQTSSFVLEGCGSGMSIWFPPKDVNGNAVAIIDGAYNLCMQYIKYYAVNGWDDIQFINYVEIINFVNFINERVNRMFCTNDYSKTCKWAYNALACDPYGDTTCQTTKNITLSPTIQPTETTKSPTLLPTVPPTSIPTSSPTETTKSPTFSPQTSSPTLSPTSPPTSIPTSPPTSIPTSPPTSPPSSPPTVQTTSIVISDTGSTSTVLTTRDNADSTVSTIIHSDILYGAVFIVCLYNMI